MNTIESPARLPLHLQRCSFRSSRRRPRGVLSLPLATARQLAARMMRLPTASSNHTIGKRVARSLCHYPQRSAHESHQMSPLHATSKPCL